MKTQISFIASGLIACLVAGTAHADLQGRDLNGSAGSFEAYYDTDLDITWLADANYAKTSGYTSYEAGGRMTWGGANLWASNLSITDGVNVYDNWRLPTTLQPDASCDGQSGFSSGNNCTGSEMGHLFYNELGGTAGQSILTSTDPDLAKFTNLQATYAYTGYWSGTEYVLGTPGSINVAWSFDFYDGVQDTKHKNVGLYALAVSPGDVAAVPEADTYALMLAGLVLIGWRARRGG